MISFSHLIFYVKDIQTALKFYQDAFDIKPKFIHESGAYAELSTGETVLAFAFFSLSFTSIKSVTIASPKAVTKVVCKTFCKVYTDWCDRGATWLAVFVG